MTELSPTHPDAVRQLDRLADRLRLVGPRLAAREGEQPQELLRAIRAGLQDLSDLAADADGRPRRRVPELADHALADQALVLGHDLLGSDPHALPGRPGCAHTGGSGADDTGDTGAEPERTDAFRAVAVAAVQRIYALL